MFALLLSLAWANEWVDHCANLIAPSTEFSVEEVIAGLDEIAALKTRLLETFSPADHTFVLVGRSNSILDGLLTAEPGIDLRRLPLSLRYYVRQEFHKSFLSNVLERYLGTGKRWVFIDFASTGATFSGLNDIVTEVYGRRDPRFGVMSDHWPQRLGVQPGPRWAHLRISGHLRKLLLADVFKPFAPQESFDLYYLRYHQRKTGALPAPVPNPRYRELFP